MRCVAALTFKIMRAPANYHLNTTARVRALIAKLGACGVLLVAANLAFSQTTRSWTGTARDFRLATANNWSPTGTPGASDTMRWDATAATRNLQVPNAGSLDGDPGNTFNVTADHPGSFAVLPWYLHIESDYVLRQRANLSQYNVCRIMTFVDGFCLQKYDGFRIGHATPLL
jgi:hypothetical protein